MTIFIVVKLYNYLVKCMFFCVFETNGDLHVSLLNKWCERVKQNRTTEPVLRFNSTVNQYLVSKNA